MGMCMNSANLLNQKHCEIFGIKNAYVVNAIGRVSPGYGDRDEERRDKRTNVEKKPRLNVWKISTS